jgi:hypothetical protein
MAELDFEDFDFDIEELLGEVEADQAVRKLRRERPWTYDIIRALRFGVRG